jgi:sugar O-acyltransferase (sialic acid O-acetyltransferase NeuD family)
MRKVVVVGAGGFGKEVMDILEAENKKSLKWHILGFIDDNPTLQHKEVRGYKVLGGTDWFSQQESKGVQAVVAIGDNRVRMKVVKRLTALGAQFCTIIHPSVTIGHNVRIGMGTIIAAGCILTSDIRIGDHCILNLGTTIGHDTILEGFVNLNPGVHISGSNTICEGAYIGTGAVTIQEIRIGEWSIVGAGAVVIENLPDHVVAVGVPARVIKSTPNSARVD